MKSMMKSILIGIGTLSVVFGVIGLFLPVIPTTPFLLLAGACYMRSSEKHHKRLLENKWLGPYLRDYYENKGIPLYAKIVSISFLWISLTVSMVFFAKILWVRIILIGIGSGVTIFLLRQKTKKPQVFENTYGEMSVQEGSNKK